MTKALIYGTGSIGSVYGYILHKAGVDVTAICRSNYEAVSKNGITIHSALWGDVHYRPHVARSVEESSSHCPFDFILVCTKAFGGRETALALQQVVSPDTAIVVAQNGIEVEKEYHQLFPQNTIISGVVWLPASPVEPGVVKMGAMERIEMGTYPAHVGSQVKVEQLASLWTLGGGTPIVHQDIQAKRWEKLAVNCAFNPMGALSRCDGANLLLSSEMADETVMGVLREVSSVAAAVGYEPSERFVEENMACHRASKQTGGKEQSMLVDVKAGRPLEVEAIFGNTVRIAKEHGVQVPRLEMLFCLAQALNFSIQRPPGRWKPLMS
ncbi:hypothetical protein M409DRAFT_37666 [Zasmidium cellare ATCC 36951]|uniref:2-dehydropantoate 2-reductase n=1 Tax=Zasmidium cellare ATCC 36951 TaxID=1080233 RepID=A0A6A6C1Z3_ZASCE|nr:uncharacterized protein M409DRAFT_37666 [Zasmidium cellare ATCC 36951]KAF2160913.1 hypothetical protein M409DRAFT_37666 [Zasmidium cellare ATCC 36951]